MENVPTLQFQDIFWILVLFLTPDHGTWKDVLPLCNKFLFYKTGDNNTPSPTVGWGGRDNWHVPRNVRFLTNDNNNCYVFHIYAKNFGFHWVSDGEF